MAKEKTGKKSKRPERIMSFEDIESAINEHVSAATTRMDSRSESKEPDESVVEVRVKPKTQSQPRLENQDDNKGEPITVSIRHPGSMAEAKSEQEPAEQSNETNRLEARVGKTIEPPVGMSELLQPKEKPVLEDTTVSVSKPQASHTDNSATKPVETGEPKTPPTFEHEHLAKPVPETIPETRPDKGSFTTATSDAPKTPLKKEQQAPTVFDTKQYHLPIKPNRHHRQHAVPTSVTVVVFVLLFLLGGFIAIKIGFVDL